MHRCAAARCRHACLRAGIDTLTLNDDLSPLALDAQHEAYVELTPKPHDRDALRLLRHADAQVAAKYRSFLTFIRCELHLLLPAATLAAAPLERVRALAHKHMLALDASGGLQAPLLITGTLARAKQFVAELYRATGCVFVAFVGLCWPLFRVCRSFSCSTGFFFPARESGSLHQFKSIREKEADSFEKSFNALLCQN